MTNETYTLHLDNSQECVALYGQMDENLRLLEVEFEVEVSARGQNLRLNGDAVRVDQARQVLGGMRDLVRERRRVTRGQVEDLIRLVKTENDMPMEEFLGHGIVVSGKKKRISAKTAGQKRYLEAIRQNDVVFGIGPAGTGKTYLAMACAVNALLSRQVKRIVLARPAVEAGESLGFLPGDLAEKVNPYLRPLYDALYDMLEFDRVNRFMQQGQVEVAPLAFMRGRTLNDAFVILDEAQNTTREQMKMFLTRLGYDSKAVVTGDITQIDLPGKEHSGLVDAVKILNGLKGLEMVWLDRSDVVRHRLVQDIIQAYENAQLTSEEAVGSPPESFADPLLAGIGPSPSHADKEQVS